MDLSREQTSDLFLQQPLSHARKGYFKTVKMVQKYDELLDQFQGDVDFYLLYQGK